MADGTRRELNTLYRIYNAAGELLYVGATTNPGLRMQEHSHHQSWWDEATDIKLERFNCRADLAAAETEAIKSESPRYNAVHAKRAPFRRRRPKGDGGICQRADGYWVGSITQGEGKPRKYFYGWHREIVENKMEAFKATLREAT